MKKFIIVNITALIILFIPTILFKNSHYICQSGAVGEGGKAWFGKAATFKEASNIAILQCKKESNRTDKCDVYNCENHFFEGN